MSDADQPKRTEERSIVSVSTFNDDSVVSQLCISKFMLKAFRLRYYRPDSQLRATTSRGPSEHSLPSGHGESMPTLPELAHRMQAQSYTDIGSQIVMPLVIPNVNEPLDRYPLLYFNTYDYGAIEHFSPYPIVMHQRKADLFWINQVQNMFKKEGLRIRDFGSAEGKTKTAIKKAGDDDEEDVKPAQVAEEDDEEEKKVVSKKMITSSEYLLMSLSAFDEWSSASQVCRCSTPSVPSEDSLDGWETVSEVGPKLRPIDHYGFTESSDDDALYSSSDDRDTWGEGAGESDSDAWSSSSSSQSSYDATKVLVSKLPAKSRPFANRRCDEDSSWDDGQPLDVVGKTWGNEFDGFLSSMHSLESVSSGTSISEDGEDQSLMNVSEEEYDPWEKSFPTKWHPDEVHAARKGSAGKEQEERHGSALSLPSCVSSNDLNVILADKNMSSEASAANNELKRSNDSASESVSSFKESSTGDHDVGDLDQVESDEFNLQWTQEPRMLNLIGFLDKDRAIMRAVWRDEFGEKSAEEYGIVTPKTLSLASTLSCEDKLDTLGELHECEKEWVSNVTKYDIDEEEEEEEPVEEVKKPPPPMPEVAEEKEEEEAENENESDMPEEMDSGGENEGSVVEVQPAEVVGEKKEEKTEGEKKKEEAKKKKDEEKKRRGEMGLFDMCLYWTVHADMMPQPDVEEERVMMAEPDEGGGAEPKEESSEESFDLTREWGPKPITDICMCCLSPAGSDVNLQRRLEHLYTNITRTCVEPVDSSEFFEKPRYDYGQRPLSACTRSSDQSRRLRVGHMSDPPVPSYRHKRRIPSKWQFMTPSLMFLNYDHEGSSSSVRTIYSKLVFSSEPEFSESGGISTWDEAVDDSHKDEVKEPSALAQVCENEDGEVIPCAGNQQGSDEESSDLNYIDNFTEARGIPLFPLRFILDKFPENVDDYRPLSEASEDEDIFYQDIPYSSEDESEEQDVDIPLLPLHLLSKWHPCEYKDVYDDPYSVSTCEPKLLYWKSELRRMLNAARKRTYYLLFDPVPELFKEEILSQRLEDTFDWWTFSSKTAHLHYFGQSITKYTKQLINIVVNLPDNPLLRKCGIPSIAQFCNTFWRFDFHNKRVVRQFHDAGGCLLLLSCLKYNHLDCEIPVLEQLERCTRKKRFGSLLYEMMPQLIRLLRERFIKFTGSDAMLKRSLYAAVLAKNISRGEAAKKAFAAGEHWINTTIAFDLCMKVMQSEVGPLQKSIARYYGGVLLEVMSNMAEHAYCREMITQHGIPYMLHLYVDHDYFQNDILFLYMFLSTIEANCTLFLEQNVAAKILDIMSVPQREKNFFPCTIFIRNVLQHPKCTQYISVDTMVELIACIVRQSAQPNAKYFKKNKHLTEQFIQLVYSFIAQYKTDSACLTLLKDISIADVLVKNLSAVLISFQAHKRCKNVSDPETDIKKAMELRVDILHYMAMQTKTSQLEPYPELLRTDQCMHPHTRTKVLQILEIVGNTADKSVRAKFISFEPLFWTIFKDHHEPDEARLEAMLRVTQILAISYPTQWFDLGHLMRMTPTLSRLAESRNIFVLEGLTAYMTVVYRLYSDDLLYIGSSRVMSPEFVPNDVLYTGVNWVAGIAATAHEKKTVRAELVLHLAEFFSIFLSHPCMLEHVMTQRVPFNLIRHVTHTDVRVRAALLAFYKKFWSQPSVPDRVGGEERLALMRNLLAIRTTANEADIVFTFKKMWKPAPPWTFDKSDITNVHEERMLIRKIYAINRWVL